MSRSHRDLSWWLSRVVLGVWVLVGLWVWKRFLAVPPETLTSGTVVDAGPLDRVRVGLVRMVHVGETPVMIIRLGEEEVVALEATCTFFPCELTWDPFARELMCPCHGDRFLPDGTVLTGRAVQPLRRIPVKVYEGRVFLLWGKRHESRTENGASPGPFSG